MILDALLTPDDVWTFTRDVLLTPDDVWVMRRDVLLTQCDVSMMAIQAVLPTSDVVLTAIIDRQPSPDGVSTTMIWDAYLTQIAFRKRDICPHRTTVASADWPLLSCHSRNGNLQRLPPVGRSLQGSTPPLHGGFHQAQKLQRKRKLRLLNK